MARVMLLVGLVVSLALLPSYGVDAGSGNYEPPFPPRIAWATTDARSFYVEFRARDEAGGFGHSYVTLGIVDSSGQVRQTVVAAGHVRLCLAANQYLGLCRVVE